ncbi:MAG: adenosylcobinamide amidohydrolase [Porphyromonadaceae bacterium]|nr:adenosylcobinamide amidohydrolase [Porphyromonadaceae bacterium]
METIEFENYLFSTPMGDKAYFHEESLIVVFAGKRGVVSASNHNGGYRDDLRYVFNHSCGRNPLIQQKQCPGIKGKNIAEHYAITATEIGLPAELSTGMGTAALIENRAIATRSHYGVEVMAVATAGVDVNGGRAGDPAAYDEFAQASLLPPPGTINIMLFINARLDPGALTRAIVTATEAKTAALQELMAVSLYSEDLATGSGTDCIIAVCNEESSTTLFNTGKHVLLGEMIGQSVKEAVKQALANQVGMTPHRQASIEWQCKRYSITQERILHFALHMDVGADADKLKPTIQSIDRDSHLFASVVSIVHLVDQHRWGMVAADSLLDLAQTMLDAMLERAGIATLNLRRERNHASEPETPVYRLLISDIILVLAHIALHRSH